MIDARVRETLARIALRPAGEWDARLRREFPSDPTMRAQALLWLHAERAAPEPEDAPPTLGDEADERYELSTRLDIGATASVWKAYDRKLGRAVAIKVFHAQNESEALDQVLAEARAASVSTSFQSSASRRSRSATTDSRSAIWASMRSSSEGVGLRGFAAFAGFCAGGGGGGGAARASRART